MKYYLSLCLIFIYSLGFNADANEIVKPKKGKIAQINKDPLDDGIIKILAIGNSFSEDGIENYLYDLAKTTNKKIVIGNLYIGGAPLSLHLKNALQDKSVYSYRKIDLDGKKTATKNTSIATAIADDNWDYISLQQASSFSGQLETYTASLDSLKKYVVNQVKTENTKYILHQTWAYAQSSTHAGFKNYNNSQTEMYNAIVKTSRTVFENKIYNFYMLVPSGTAIQNMRTTYIGDKLTRDGYHLELNYGRFTAACTWYEKLFKANVLKNDFVPKTIAPEIALMAKTAAHEAVKKPYEVTVLKKFAVKKEASN
jgi:hypothetical protein